MYAPGLTSEAEAVAVDGVAARIMETSCRPATPVGTRDSPDAEKGAHASRLQPIAAIQIIVCSCE